MRLSALTLILFLSVSAFVFAETPPPPEQTATQVDTGGSISGQVMIKSNFPMTNAVVLLFNKDMGAPPHPHKYWRIPDMITNTDNKGKFSIELQHGTYYLMVAQKDPNGEIGPPKKKEFLYFHGDKNGNARPITVTPGSKIDLGILAKSTVWTPKMVLQDKDMTAVEGIVVDMEGKPVNNAVVFAYLNPEAAGKPAFVSDRSDKKGRYQLRLYEGGTYYLKVRSVIGGGTPKAGEYQNTTEEFQPTEVILTKGQRLQDIALKVDKFSGKGLKGTGQPDKTWKNTGNFQPK
jgi:hypothetical protein